LEERHGETEWEKGAMVCGREKRPEACCEGVEVAEDVFVIVKVVDGVESERAHFSGLVVQRPADVFEVAVVKKF